MAAPLKLLYPIRRRPTVTHDELAAYWREVHMPAVIAHLTPRRYSVTLFDQRREAPFDGMASVTYDDEERARLEQGRTMPAAVANDGFGDRIEPTDRLEVTEHVVLDGEPPPDAHKLTGLVTARPGVDPRDAWRAWLDDHAPNVAEGLAANGGVRYVVNLADRHRREGRYLGAAELWFVDRDAARAHLSQVGHDRFMDLTEAVLLPGTEIVGIA
jgi:hypothetical protein